MNTKGNSLNDVTERLVDAILADHILERNHLLKRVRVILQAWVRATDRPVDYNNIKTDKGILQRTIEQKDTEKMFWLNKFRENKSREEMQTHYDEIHKKLVEEGYKKDVQPI